MELNKEDQLKALNKILTIAIKAKDKKLEKSIEEKIKALKDNEIVTK